MCGIAGVLYFNKERRVEEEQLSRFRDALIHRGPDFGANYIDSNIGLAHRRLSIIDLSQAANQPMFSADGRFIIVFNGEIYNFQILKKELEGQGHFFTTNSDTEVLLKMYEVYKEEMLTRLNGMFSFAVWDKKERELFAARGRAGIKPLYYVIDNQQFLFASEAKAILKYGFPLQVEEDGFNELLMFRFVAGQKTLFKGINKLEAGHFLKVKEDGRLKISRWWNLKEEIQNHPIINNPQEWFNDTFNDAIKIHMISDVPVGVLLSGGLDSSSICASLHQQNFKDIHTFNVGFKNFVDDESQDAKILASYFNFPFHSILVEDEDLAENLSIANYVHDEPLIHQNEPQLVAISRFAKKFVTVLLSGEGADEFLGGYIRYRPIAYYKHRNWINAGLKLTPSAFKSERIKKLERYFTIANPNDMLLYNSANSYPADFLKIGVDVANIHIAFREEILDEAKELYPKSLQRQAMYFDQHTYLNSLNDRNDRATMAASIECRVPFLDSRLMAGLGTLGDDWFFKGKKSKHILREAYTNILPMATLGFRKVGFSVPWIDFIFKNKKFKQHWNDMETCDIFRMGIFKFINIKQLKLDLAKGDHTNEQLLRQLFFISLWWKQYMEHFSK